MARKTKSLKVKIGYQHRDHRPIKNRRTITFREEMSKKIRKEKIEKLRLKDLEQDIKYIIK